MLAAHPRGGIESSRDKRLEEGEQQALFSVHGTVQSRLEGCELGARYLGLARTHRHLEVRERGLEQVVLVLHGHVEPTRSRSCRLHQRPPRVTGHASAVLRATRASHRARESSGIRCVSFGATCYRFDNVLKPLLEMAADLSVSLATEDRYHRFVAVARRMIPTDAIALLRLDGEVLVPVVATACAAKPSGDDSRQRITHGWHGSSPRADRYASRTRRCPIRSTGCSQSKATCFRGFTRASGVPCASRTR